MTEQWEDQDYQDVMSYSLQGVAYPDPSTYYTTEEDSSSPHAYPLPPLPVLLAPVAYDNYEQAEDSYDDEDDDEEDEEPDEIEQPLSPVEPLPMKAASAPILGTSVPPPLAPPPSLPPLPPLASTAPTTPVGTPPAAPFSTLPPSIAPTPAIPLVNTMKVDGRLQLKSQLGLAWKGWKSCTVSLVGDVLNYSREDVPIQGGISLADLKTVSGKGVKELPTGCKGILLKIGDVRYALCTSDAAQHEMWIAVFKNIKRQIQELRAPKKKKWALRKSGSRRPTVAIRTIELARQRLGDLGPQINNATYQLLELLFNARPTFINAIFAVTQQADADKVASYLARIFAFVDRAHFLIKNVVCFEVESTTSQNSLFRQNSLASKIMTAYSRLVATQYLRDLLGPIVEKIRQIASKLEVQPDKLSEAELQKLPEHMENVKVIVSELLNKIKQSTSKLPIECRMICRDLKEAIASKFPEAVDIAIAGYLFLRLINPALVVPDGIGLVDSADLSADHRRALVIVSKVVLNIANQIEFKKEEYMMDFNSFTREKFEFMRQFYTEAATVPDKNASRAIMKVDPVQFLEEVARLYKILHSNADRLVTQLGSDTALANGFKTAVDSIGSPDQMPSAAQEKSAQVATKKSILAKLGERITHFFNKDGKETKEDKRNSIN